MHSELPTDFPKDLVSRYDGISYLARGGMGVLFRAHDKTLDKLVAIKALPSRNLLGVEKVVRFQKEAKAAGHLDHLNIVKVLDFGVTRSGDPYLIMDYVNGPSLSDSLHENGTPDLYTALRYFVEIADGLSHAHKNGVVHRDIKPHNIMLEEVDDNSFIAKIVDFGVAHMRRVEADTEGFESTGGNIIGSPGYVSPEVVSGGKADQRSDVYSLGCLMFETLAGRLPFQTSTALETMTMHVNAPPPEIIEWLGEEENQELASAMAAIVMRCLQKSPDARYQSAEEVKLALVDCADLLDEEHRAVFTFPDTTPGGIFKSWSFPISGSSKLPIAAKITAVLLPLILIAIVAPSIINSKQGGASIEETKIKNFEAPDQSALTSASTFVDVMEPTSDLVMGNKVNACDVAKRLKNRGLTAVMSYAKITDEAMEELGKYPIHDIDFAESQISQKGWKILSKMTDLRMLSLDRVSGLSDDDLNALTPMKMLSSLSLERTNISDKGLKILTKNRRLKCISLMGCTRVTTAGVAQLKVIPTLLTITIGGTNVSPLPLQDFPVLQDLNVHYKSLTSAEVDAIASIKNLAQLTITGCAIDRKEFFKLLKCRHLKCVQMALMKNVSEQDAKDFKAEYFRLYKRRPVLKTTFPYE